MNPIQSSPSPEPATLEAMYQAIREWPEGKYFGTSEVTAFVKWYYSLPVTVPTPTPDADGWIPWKHGDPFICDRFQITYADGCLSKSMWTPSEHDKDTKWYPDAQTVAYKPAPDATYERWEWNQETGKYERKEGGQP